MVQENTQESDIRWKQRFENYGKSLALLCDIVNSIDKSTNLSNRDKLSLIKSFEISFELAWNVMKDYLSYKGISDIVGSRDSIRHAYSQGLILNGQIWMEMIEARNKTSHTYNEETANELTEKVIKSYFGEFLAFKEKMCSGG
ncbi:MAG: nucleotidyltransferase substrate binding protein [Fibromonadaceae bacterium]|nr:nucleotidyltransferase substrate binding protein [Fibromonadaceae bacterium]